MKKLIFTSLVMTLLVGCSNHPQKTITFKADASDIVSLKNVADVKAEKVQANLDELF